MLIVSSNETTDITQSLDLARALPMYFTAAAVAAMENDFRSHKLYVAKDDNVLVGFMSLNHKSDLVTEISWLAVDSTCHRHGIGTNLLDAAVQDLRADGCSILEVKTLAHTVPYEPYERTHSFYRKHGFVTLEIIRPYPGWDIDSPCEIYVRAL